MEESGNGESVASGSGRRCTSTLFCSRTSLLILMTGYALLGALLFKSLEGGGDRTMPVNVQRSREDCLRELWLITERLNVLYEKNWTRLVTEQLKRFERAVAESGRSNGLSAGGSVGPQWTFGGALLYSLTLLTTVGYGRLSPRTALGKIVAIIYALIGVPLMLILLSALGSMLASGARKIYSKLCCIPTNQNKDFSPTVGYQKAPSSPSAKSFHKSFEDTASIQINSVHGTPNHSHCKANHHQPYVDHHEVPKRAILATVRATHARGRCRQGSIHQLVEATHCAAHGPSLKNSVMIGIASDLDPDDPDDNDHILCQHDTPSRVPLIWRPPEPPTPRSESPLPPLQTALSTPSVPASIVLLIFVSYVAVGAAAFSSTSGWSFLDATYFCFIALSTIGVGDKLPQSADMPAQMQIFACCVYLFFGLVVLAMCFSLVHEELTLKCKQVANSMGFVKH